MDARSLDLLEQAAGSLFSILFLIEVWRGVYGRQRMGRSDQWINLVAFVQNRLVMPGVALGAALLCRSLLPQHEGALSGAISGGWAWAAAFVGYALIHETIHYAYHRAAHRNPWLWKLHRAHHSAREMSVGMASREHVAWQLFQPVNWFAGLAIHLGLGPVVALALTIRTIVGTLGHSNLRVDLVLYRVPALRPWIRALEWLVTTPDLHNAHHGIGPDGAPLGNYAPTFILIDRLFGTYVEAPHAVQTRVGVDDGGDDHWVAQLYWPLRRPATTPARPRGALATQG